MTAGMATVALEATRIRVRPATLLPGLAVVVAGLVAWWAGMPYVVGVWHDDGVYALLGRAIASGHGFHYTQLPGAPAATHYPPLYPLLLAAVWRVAPSFPDNIAAFLALNAMLVGAAALGAYHFARARLDWRAESAALFALGSSLTSPVLALSGAVLSEPLFLAALWPVLLVSERAADRFGDRRDALVAGAAVGVLMLVRTHAVALLAAAVVMLVLRSRPMHAMYAFAAAAIVVSPWQLWTVVATPRVAAPLEGAYGSYLGWFATGLREGGVPFLVATARINLRELWLLLQDRVVPGGAAFPQVLAAALFLALVAVGAWAVARRAPVTAWFLGLYLAVVVVWPYTPWRFLWAVWPLVLLCAAAGVAHLWSVASSRGPRALVALIVALPAFGMLRTEWNAYASRAWSAPALRAGEQITPLVAWVGRNTRPSDVVLAEGEQVISLFTGRRAAPTAPFSAREYVTPRTLPSSTAELRQMLVTVPARYVLPLAPVQLEAARALSGARPGLRAVAPLPRSTVFEVVR
jgi:hypothetical protein